MWLVLLEFILQVEGTLWCFDSMQKYFSLRQDGSDFPEVINKHEYKENIKGFTVANNYTFNIFWHLNCLYTKWNHFCLYVDYPQGFSQPKVTWSAPFYILSQLTSAFTEMPSSSCSSWLQLVRALTATWLSLRHEAFWPNNKFFQYSPSHCCSSHWNHLHFCGPL